MTVRTSRFTYPIAPGAEDARTIGWWAAFFGVIALAHFVGALVVSYLYLRAGQATWPPDGVTPPALTPPLLATVATVVAAAAATAHRRLTATARPIAAMVAAAGTITIGLVAVGARLVGLGGVGFRWDDHVFGSLYWLIAGTHVLLVLAAVLGSAASLAQHVIGAHDEDDHDEIQVLQFTWWFVAVSAIALYVPADIVAHL